MLKLKTDAEAQLMRISEIIFMLIMMSQMEF